MCSLFADVVDAAKDKPNNLELIALDSNRLTLASVETLRQFFGQQLSCVHP